MAKFGFQKQLPWHTEFIIVRGNVRYAFRKVLHKYPSQYCKNGPASSILIDNGLVESEDASNQPPSHTVNSSASDPWHGPQCLFGVESVGTVSYGHWTNSILHERAR